MPAPTRVRVKLDNGAETTVPATYAKSHGLKVVGSPAVRNGRTIPPKYPVDLRGAALDAALDEAGLPKTGTATQKRERLAEFQSSTVVTSDARTDD